MDWLPTTTPPAFVSEEYSWPMSAPVLGYCRDGSMRVVRLEHIDEDDLPVWKTDCSERWTVEVTHWMPLPQAPGIAVAGTGAEGAADNAQAAIKPLAGEKYGPKQIAKELMATALGKAYYGNALYVAKDIPALTDEDRWVLQRWLDGAQVKNDWRELQLIAHKIACDA